MLTIVSIAITVGIIALISGIGIGMFISRVLRTDTEEWRDW